MRLSLTVRISLLLLTCFVLSSCANDDLADLDAKLKVISDKPRGKILPFPVFKAYEAFTYSSVNKRSPFEQPIEIFIEEEIKAKKKINKNSNVKPDLVRRRELLENYSLESMNFVGTISRTEITGENPDDELWALIDDGKGGIHRIKQGNFLGKNHGKVISINEAYIEISEIISTGLNDENEEEIWSERPRKLVLRDQ